jgi:hypothetical protein
MKQTKEDLNPVIARRIIEAVGSSGTPPEFGFQYFTAGLDVYLNVIESEYLSSYVKSGGSVFKMIIGVYGGGKTHFLFNVRELCWKEGYIASYISLTPQETPFSKLEQIYKAIVNNLVYPQSPEALLGSYDRGIEAVINKWFFEKYKEISQLVKGDILYNELENYVTSLGPYESTSFKNAVAEAFLSLAKKSDADFNLITQWLKGESILKAEVKKFKIFDKIEKTTAFKMIRSLVQWLIEIDYSGIIVLLDEAEQTPSMSSKEKDLLLSNLRELIDLCVQVNFKNTMWFYAVPDENFLEGKKTIYEALRQRVNTVFDEKINPTGVKIYLENIPIEPKALLKKIGKKLAKIYQIAYNVDFDEKTLNETIINITNAAYEKRWDTGIKRVFVQNIIPAFHKLRVSDKVVKPEDIGMK